MCQDGSVWACLSHDLCVTGKWTERRIPKSSSEKVIGGYKSVIPTEDNKVSFLDSKEVVGLAVKNSFSQSR